MEAEEKAWSALYILAEHWQADLKFSEDELRFLKELIGKYFISLIEVEHIDHTKQLVDGLLDLEKKRKRLEKDIGEHLHQLTKLVDSQFLQDTQGYKERHSKLDTEMFEFLKDFRRVKKELFHVTEQIMKSEKAKHLLGT